MNLTTQCDEKCWTAHGSSCNCECGGKNHGASVAGRPLAPIDRSQRMPPNAMTNTELNRESAALQKQLDALVASGGKGAAFDKEKDSVVARLLRVRIEMERRGNDTKLAKGDPTPEYVRSNREQWKRDHDVPTKFREPKDDGTHKFAPSLRKDLPYNLQYRPEDLKRWAEPSGRDGKIVGLIVGDATAVAITKDRGGYGTIAHQLPHEALPEYENYANDTQAREASYSVRERIGADFKKLSPKTAVRVVKPNENLRETIDAFEKKYKRRNEYGTDKRGRTVLRHPRIE